MVKKILVMFFFVVLVSPFVVQAQDSVSGMVSGSVTVEGQEMRYIKDDVRVIIYEKDSKQIFGDITLDKDGNFSYGGIPDGTYVLRIESDGFGSVYYEDAYSFEAAKNIVISEDNVKVDNLNIALSKDQKAEDDVTLPARVDDANVATIDKEAVDVDVSSSEDKWSFHKALVILVLGILVLIIVIETYYIITRGKKGADQSDTSSGS